MFYRLIHLIIRFINFVFFSRIEFQLPTHLKGPLIFTANHPNMFLDVVVIGPYLPGKVHFIAKSSLFKNPLLRLFLNNLGVVPVYRKEHGEQGDNQNAFQKVIEALERQETIVIFPEGTSHAKDSLLPLKTGTARMAFETEAKNNFQLGVQIVPLGLHFAQRDRFRSKVLIRVGEPILVKEFKSAYEKDSKEAVNQLTTTLYERMRKITLNLLDEHEGEMLRTLFETYTKLVAKERPESFSEIVNVRDSLLEAYRWHRNHKPRQLHQLYRKISSFLNSTEQFGVCGSHLAKPYEFMKVFRYTYLRIPLLALGAPLYFCGMLTHYLPYRIPGLIASRIEDITEKGTSKMLWGAFLFPFFYFLYFVIICYFYTLKGAILFLAILPFLGIYSLFYLDFLVPFLNNMLTFFKLNWKRAERNRLLQMSESIQRDWQILQEEYQRERVRELESETVKSGSL